MKHILEHAVIGSIMMLLGMLAVTFGVLKDVDAQHITVRADGYGPVIIGQELSLHIKSHGPKFCPVIVERQLIDSTARIVDANTDSIDSLEKKETYSFVPENNPEPGIALFRFRAGNLCNVVQRNGFPKWSAWLEQEIEFVRAGDSD